ncbi:GtrA family protein [Paenibacillus sp. Y412MC10]|uniref:GtrA family protein n=1 Tax=Geobacillus sp. (strain Y412MC10) TaxID=481743 RepID=UPI001642818B
MITWKQIRSNIIPFIIYGGIGVIGTVIHTGTLTLLVELFNTEPLIASCVGFILSLIVSYILNLRFTFHPKNVKLVTVFLKYALVSLTGLFLNLLIMYITVYILQFMYLYGQVLVILVVPINNFLLNKFWAFRVRAN